MREKFMECAQCNNPISLERQRRFARFCNEECRKKFLQEKYREQNPYMGNSTGATGAISELRVAVDLMSKGYDVFRALSPSCSCDLAILKERKLFRIEVRTAHKTLAGTLPSSMRKEQTDGKTDVHALVLKDQIIYDPPLEPK